MSLDLPSTYDPLPADVASWLTAHDFERLTRTPGRAALWSRGPVEVLQPTLLEATDYELRFGDLLRRLSSAVQRPVEALAQEMVNEGSDVSEWRALGLRDRDFSVPLEDGFSLVQSVRNAFVAVANATIQRRGYFGHSTLKAARQHARTVRMGQTRRGSYVVPIISRVPGAVEQEDDDQTRFELDVSAQPFERRVMAQLAQSLSTIQELAVSSSSEPTMKQLIESVGDGVSHELCLAVATALKAPSFADMAVSFSWARRVPGNPAISTLTFPKDSADVIGRMADGLRGSSVIGEQGITGYVRSHRHDAGEDEGLVYMRAPIGDQMRTVGMTLSSEQLHEALLAAAEEKPVYVRGRLVREQGRAWRFESVTQLGVSEAAPLAWGREEPND
jgi:hypothetical protein